MNHAPFTAKLSHLNKLDELKVSVIQYKGDRSAYRARQTHLLNVIEMAVEEGAKLIVAPECACSEYLFENVAEAKQYSETPKSHFTRALAALSKHAQIWCVVGIIELGDEERLHNSALITTPTGELHYYRKRLLFDADYTWAESGDRFPVELSTTNRLEAFQIQPLESDLHAPYPLFDVFGWRMTVGICMDLNDQRFTDFCRHAHVDLIAFPTNWLDEGVDVLEYWVSLLHEVDSVTLLAANSHGTEGAISYCGGSAILQMTPPTLLGRAPQSGDYLITTSVSHPERLDCLSSESDQENPSTPTDC